MSVTKNLAEYINEKGISLSHIQRVTNIPYEAVRSSLSPNGRGRELRADELIAICIAIDKNPLDFSDRQ